jgi:hypothetical protein
MDTWVIVGLVVGVAVVVGVIVAVRARTRRPEAGVMLPPPGQAPDGLLTCPSCAHRFKRPDIMILTKADVKRYGRDPVQCPQCHHIWNAGGRPHRIRGY